MVSVVAKFDGTKIVLPKELLGAAPADVLIVYPAKDAAAPVVPPAHSIWDVFGKSPNPRTTEEINQQIREERDA